MNLPREHYNFEAEAETIDQGKGELKYTINARSEEITNC
jgi:hypothetical protein